MLVLLIIPTGGESMRNAIHAIPRALLVAAAFFAIPTLISPERASAQEPATLIGTWRHSEAATQAGPATTQLMRFSPDGSYYGQLAIPPGPNGVAGGYVHSRGVFRVVKADMFAFRLDLVTICSSSGACTSCPGDSNTCTYVRASMPELGVWHQSDFQLRSQNQLNVGGVLWFRIE
jgi:hypothetical protein